MKGNSPPNTNILIVVKYVFRSLSYPLRKVSKTLNIVRRSSLENELLEYCSTSKLISIDFLKRMLRDNHEIVDYMKQWLFLAVGFSRKFVKSVRKIGRICIYREVEKKVIPDIRATWTSIDFEDLVTNHFHYRYKCIDTSVILPWSLD